MYLPSLRVFILTTNGPSRLVYLGPELADSGVSSAIRVDGDIQPLPISAPYADFIDTIVQRFSGHRTYRADVSNSIDGGNSWQLGLLVAHWLLEETNLKLAIEDELADVDLFVTGEVRDRPGLGQVEILSVNSIPAKIHLARKAISEAQHSGRQAFVILPSGNVHDFESYTGSEPLEPDYQSIYCGTFGELTDQLSTELTRHVIGPKAIDSDPAGNQTKRQKVKLIAGIGALCIAVGLYLTHSFLPAMTSLGNNPAETAELDETIQIYTSGQSLDRPGIYVTFNAVMPADRQDCSGNRFRNSPDVLIPVPEPMKTQITMERGESVCGFSLSITNHLDQHVRATSHLFRSTSGMEHEGSETSRIEPQIIEPGRSIDMKLNLPRFRMGNGSWLFFSTFMAGTLDALSANAGEASSKIDGMHNLAPDKTTYRKHITFRE